MDKFLTWFAYAWFTIAVLLNILAIFSAFMMADSVWGAWETIQEWYSPINVVNYIAEIGVLSPGLAAIWWRNKRREKASIR